MKTVIVGGVAAGMSAATRLRRLDEQATITVFERGPDVSFANCGLPYAVGDTIAETSALRVQTPAQLRARFAIDVRVRTEVLGIDRAHRTVRVRDLISGGAWDEPYDTLILAPGASPIRPPLPGIDLPQIHMLRHIPDVVALRERIGAGAKRALVVGGGAIGIEMAEAFLSRELAVTVVELAPQILPFVDPEIARAAQRELEHHGVIVHTGVGVVGFAADPSGGVIATTTTGTLMADVVLLAIGVRPETPLARDAGLALGKTGAIAVDAQMRTSDPAIFAVGDAVEVTHTVTGEAARIALAGPANRMGRIAADTIAGLQSAYRGTQGTAIVKVMDVAVAATGASAAQLARAGRAFRSVTVHAGHHAGYYPGAERLTLKMLYEPTSGALLGAQAIGKAGVDKRIDILAVALRHGATVFDLEHEELAYAPPYGAAKDPVHMAAFAAVNDLTGTSVLIPASDVAGARAAGAALLDVRSAREVAAEPVAADMCIPVDELRARLHELPSDRELLVTCAVGQRGHVAQRVLRQHGFRTRNVSGGAASLLLVSR